MRKYYYSCQCRTVTEIKKEWFDVKLEAKKLKQSGAWLKWEVLGVDMAVTVMDVRLHSITGDVTLSGVREDVSLDRDLREDWGSNFCFYWYYKSSCYVLLPKQ